MKESALRARNPLLEVIKYENRQKQEFETLKFAEDIRMRFSLKLLLPEKVDVSLHGWQLQEARIGEQFNGPNRHD